MATGRKRKTVEPDDSEMWFPTFQITDDRQEKELKDRLVDFLKSKGVERDSLRRDMYNYSDGEHRVAWNIYTCAYRRAPYGMQLALASDSLSRRSVHTGYKTAKQVWEELKKKSDLIISDWKAARQKQEEAKAAARQQREWAERYQKIERKFGFCNPLCKRTHTLDLMLFNIPLENYEKFLSALEELAPDALEALRSLHPAAEKGE